MAGNNERWWETLLAVVLFIAYLWADVASHGKLPTKVCVVK